MPLCELEAGNRPRPVCASDPFPLRSHATPVASLRSNPVPGPARQPHARAHVARPLPVGSSAPLPPPLHSVAALQQRPRSVTALGSTSESVAAVGLTLAARLWLRLHVQSGTARDSTLDPAAAGYSNPGLSTRLR